MKAEELRKKTIEELNKLLIESKKKFQDLKFDLSLGKVKSINVIRELKKDIARIKTVIKEKTLNNK
ncbi:MAG: 50S ribosomal protein L29 [Minisyncoccia bacterium]|jgi:large subunit ribosomal protein L29